MNQSSSLSHIELYLPVLKYFIDLRFSVLTLHPHISSPNRQQRTFPALILLFTISAAKSSAASPIQGRLINQVREKCRCYSNQVILERVLNITQCPVLTLFSPVNWFPVCIQTR